jgi:hypothetical protein
MNNPNGKRSKVFRFGSGQWALHTSTGTKVIIVGARRFSATKHKKLQVLLLVARVTGTKKPRFIVAKASSFTARKGGPAPTPLVVGV